MRIIISAPPLSQSVCKLRRPQAAGAQEDEEVVDKVGGFTHQRSVIFGDGGKRGFNAFFAHFLRDPVQRAVE